MSGLRPGGLGVNVCGFLSAELGLGEGARHILRMLQLEGIPFSTFDVGSAAHRRQEPYPKGRGAGPRYGINIISLNGPELREFAMQTGPGFFRDRYTIAQWAYEASSLPPDWAPGLALVDEIWVPSQFVAKIVRRATRKTVRVLPWPILPRPGRASRETLGLPDGFLFLTSFDFFSSVTRKNPQATIRAFRQAFPHPGTALLLVKTINGDRFPKQSRQIRRLAAGRPDIIFSDGYMARRHWEDLIAACDCYVSLHRAEGFGLALAEAMAAGKPVIATGYSGNLEFMNERNGILVSSRMARVQSGDFQYRHPGNWGNPVLEEAAQAMRRVCEDREWSAALGGEARRQVLQRHSLERRARLLRLHLERARRRGRARNRNRYSRFLARVDDQKWSLGIVVQVVSDRLRPYPALHALGRRALASMLRMVARMQPGGRIWQATRPRRDASHATG